jgi:FkbM family methyltransferase
MVQGRAVFVNLQDGLSHMLLSGSPWTRPPWEVHEQLLMRRLVRAGDVVYDIGAHIGLHTVLLAELAGPRGAVHAFEPNSTKAPVLTATVRQWPNTRLHRFALGATIERQTLFVPTDQSMASLADWTEGRVGPVTTEACEVRRMDDLIADGSLPAPDFIKCDVEGGELGVFTGARATLDRREAPIILYEANALSVRGFGVALSAATDFLRRLESPHYEIFHQQPGRIVPIDRFDPSYEHFNVVAIPRARRERLGSSLEL